MWYIQYYEAGQWRDAIVSVSGLRLRTWQEAQRLADAKEQRTGLPHRVAKA